MRLLAYPLIFTTAACLAACGDDDDPSDSGNADTGTSGPETRRRPITLSFAAQAGDTAISCGTVFPNMGTTSSDVRIRDFRLYVSNIELLDADGTAVPLELDEDSVWQSSQVALLDFEDGSDLCSETGNSEMNSRVTGEAVIGAITGVRFEIGVPFEENHIDPAATDTPSPLTLTSMFWVWRGGYKFVRIDLQASTQPEPFNYNLHIGSTACESASPTEAPSVPCGRPNRPSVELSNFDPEGGTIVFDLAALLTGVDVTTNTMDTPPGCMSSPMEPADCGPVYANFGLDFETGACNTDCANQAFVRGE